MDNISIFKNPIFIFSILLFIFANFMQSLDPEMMGHAGSIFEYFTSVVLWILALVTFCMGARPRLVYWR